MRTSRAMILIAFLPCLVSAEERFYQVMGADGRMQLIHDAAPANSATPQADKAPVDAGVVVDGKSEVLGKKSKPSNKLLDVYAPYDSEKYVDSDAMDEAHESAGNGARQHFYVIPDGVGQRIEGMTEEAPVAPVATVSEDAHFVDLRQSHTPRAISEVRGLQSGCLLEQNKIKAKPLAEGQLGDLVFDKRLANHVQSGEIVELYRLDTPGLRSATIKSYAMTDDEPAFVLPLVAFADKNGCVSRVDDAYFQRYRSASRYKHAMLEATLVLHVDDVYVLVVMPGERKNSAGAKLEYRVSSIGRVSLKWQ